MWVEMRAAQVWPGMTVGDLEAGEEWAVVGRATSAGAVRLCLDESGIDLWLPFKPDDAVAVKK